MQKQKGIDKFIVKMVSKTVDENKKIEILNKNINKFIAKLQKFSMKGGK
jgi:hypothetical protein